jgi:hypothetical protein
LLDGVAADPAPSVSVNALTPESLKAVGEATWSIKLAIAPLWR